MALVDHTAVHLARWTDTSVEQQFRRIVASDSTRDVVARIFASSIRLANHAAPSRWGVTLKARLIRLNVGPLEALLVTPDYLELMVDLEHIDREGKSDLLRALPPISKGHYSSMPTSAYAAIALDRDDLPVLVDELGSAHKAHIASAAESKKLNGALRKGHHPGLVEVLAKASGTVLSQPAYVTVSRPAQPAPIASGSFPAGGFREGQSLSVVQNRRERDRRARQLCLDHHGYACVVCGFSFGAAYGARAAGLIHVHHLEPLHQGGPRETDPIRDLVPVCPNCHLVIHTEDPCLSIESVRALMIDERGA